MRLFRVDTSRPRVEGLSGRWWSDDPRYILERYAKSGSQWWYIDLPDEEAEEYRYERVREREPNLYGVERKDFVLPAEYLSRANRLPAREVVAEYPPPPTPEYLSPESFFPATEITSNVARPGKVLYYDRESGYIAVVKSCTSQMARVVVKNRRLGLSIEKELPIRIVWQL